MVVDKFLGTEAGLTKGIVVKYPSDADSEQFKHEITLYQRILTEAACSDVVHCFLALPNAIFLFNCTQGSLEEGFHSRQIREPAQGFPGKVIKVTAKDSEDLIYRWTQQLVSGGAFLESLNIVHDDVHPRNLLFDEHLNWKLSDFDSYGRIGEDFLGALAPYARVLNDGPEKGGFGACGARTEQFAIGSILYIILNGFDPYEDIDIDPEEIVDQLQALVRPEIGDSFLEQFVRRCWLGEFSTFDSLKSQVFKFKSSALGAVKIDIGEERRLCEGLVQSGLLDGGLKTGATEWDCVDERGGKGKARLDVCRPGRKNLECIGKP